MHIFQYNKELKSFRGTDTALLVKSIYPQEMRTVQVAQYSAKSDTCVLLVVCYVLPVACLTVFCLWHSVVKQGSLQ